MPSVEPLDTMVLPNISLVPWNPQPTIISPSISSTIDHNQSIDDPPALFDHIPLPLASDFVRKISLEPVEISSIPRKFHVV